MVGTAVVAEVQPEHLVAQTEQARGGQAHVIGIGAALPAMQQQHGAAWRRIAGRDAHPALQAHTVAAIEDMFAGDSAAGGQQLAAADAPQGAAAQHRLHVRIAQPARRQVVGGVHARIAPALRLTAGERRVRIVG